MVSVEDLQKTIEWLRDTTNDNVIYIDRDMKRELGNVINDLIKLNEIYKSRIDKAIEYIKEYGRDKQLEEGYLMNAYNLAMYNITLLEILGDKE